MLKKIFPLGLLVFADRIKNSLVNVYRYAGFFMEWHSFKKQAKQANDARFVLSAKNFFPILYEKARTQDFDRHYVFHLAWAARKVAEIKPTVHSDISSSLHFSTIVSAFCPVDFYDYRPADIKLSNFTSRSADLLNLPFPDNSIKSLSCMHTIEHIGLGRYGDPIDPSGDTKAMKELCRVLAVGGDFLFVVPMGKAEVMFNAYRVYSYAQVMEFAKGLELKEFTLLPDIGGPIENADPSLVEGQVHGCGFFWFKKPHA